MSQHSTPPNADPQSEQQRELHDLQLYQIELQLQNEELARTNLQLETARSRYADLFECAPIGYLIANAEGLIEEANRTCCELLEVQKPALVRRRLALFVRPEQRRLLTHLLRRTLASPGRQTAELQFMRPDGSHFTGQLECLATGQPGELPKTCRLAVIDISIQKAAQEEILRLNETLEERVEIRTLKVRELSSELEQVTTAVAQDLMAPLRRIVSFTEMVQKEAAPDTRQERHLEHVLTSAGRMQHLIEALLEFAGSGSMRLRLSSVDLNRVLAEVQAATAPLTEGRTVQFQSCQLPVVSADTQAMRLIFTHLISNALKFTRPIDTAQVQISVQEDRQEYLFSVRDNGVGFNMRYRDRLFSLFRRLHSEREFEGLGIGLATVRRVISRYGGRVWAEGTPQKGATFWFTLPKQPTLLE